MWLDELADDALDPQSRAPLHQQLSDAVRARITDGSLPAGSSLPTEAQLQSKFGISRSVVRQALLALSAEGLVTRGRGRGSVVAPRGEHHRLVQRISGLSTQLAHVTTRVLSLGEADDARAREALGVATVVELRRVRSTDGEPIAVIHTWLPAAIAGDLTAAELTNASLHATLKRTRDITVVAGRRQVRGVAASATLARQLEIETGAPLLLLEGTSVDQAGRPVEVFRTWHRADRVVFDIDVLPGSDARTAAFDGERAADSALADEPVTAAATPDLADRITDLSRELAELAALARDRDSGRER